MAEMLGCVEVNVGGQVYLIQCDSQQVYMPLGDVAAQVILDHVKEYSPDIWQKVHEEEE